MSEMDGAASAALEKTDLGEEEKNELALNLLTFRVIPEYMILTNYSSYYGQDRRDRFCENGIFAFRRVRRNVKR